MKPSLKLWCAFPSQDQKTKSGLRPCATARKMSLIVMDLIKSTLETIYDRMKSNVDEAFIKAVMDEMKSKKGASPMGKNKSWACPYSKMCKTWRDFDDFIQKPAFCLVGAHITQVQNNKSQPKRPQPFPRAYFGLLSRHLFSSMKIRVFTQPNAFRR